MTVEAPRAGRFLPRAEVSELPWRPMAHSVGVDSKTLYAEGSTIAGLLRLRPEAEEVSHLHHDREHHLWVLEGTVRVGSTELVAGSYVHVPPGVRHTLRDAGQGSLLFYVFGPSPSQLTAA